MNSTRRLSAIAVLIFFIACVATSAQTSVDWPGYGGGNARDHYSALKQINRANVSRLKTAWSFDTGEKGQIQDNPLIIGHTLYAFTPTLKVIALDAATGQLKWKFDSGIAGAQPSRGMTWWTDGKESRLFAGIMNFLYCLDPETGKPIASFGESGRIDLRKELRGNYRENSIAATTPGIVYKDLYIISGRDPETHPAPPGDVRAFDVHSGKLVWTFHTIPHPGEPGYETWPADAWKTAGAANNWAGMALDEKRGIVYAPTGSAVFDFYGADRVGDDLYANTILALDAATGTHLWHFQGVHHDIWDRDFPSTPSLVTVKRNGKPVDALAQISKQGYLFVFDRVTGKPLFPIRELPYPASTVPGEVTSPTQPKPDLPEPFGRQRVTADMLTNRTPEAHAWALKEFSTLRSDGQFLPFAVDKQTIIFPGYDGGGEWGGPAVDPTTGIIYINETEMAWTGGLTATPKGGGPGAQVYQSQCAMCHGPERNGAPPDFPSLVDILKRLKVQEVTDNVKHGKGRMPSFPNIDDAQLDALVEYLRAGGPEAETLGIVKELTAVPALALAAQPPVDNAGAAVYADHCAICHGDHMEGIPPGFPMLLGVANRDTRDQVVSVIQKGKDRMPALPEVQGSDLDALLRYLGMDAKTQPPAEAASAAALDYTFTGYRKFLDPDGYPAIAPPWGTLNAIDMNTGKYLWKVPIGEYPELAKQGIKDTGSEMYGGPIVTGGGVVFIGATVYDRKFRAFDTRNGKMLWETELPFSAMATPSTYMVDGRQYVVTVSTGGRDPKGPVGGAYIAFALPQ